MGWWASGLTRATTSKRFVMDRTLLTALCAAWAYAAGVKGVGLGTVLRGSMGGVCKIPIASSVRARLFGLRHEAHCAGLGPTCMAVSVRPIL